MAPSEKSRNERASKSRRSFVKGLGVAGAVLPTLMVWPRTGFAEDASAAFASAAIDWKQFAGQTITLTGAIHPWSSAITPLLTDFTKLTGISVVTDFQLETTFLGALPIKLTSGSRTPDVFMFLTYGQGISSGFTHLPPRTAEKQQGKVEQVKKALDKDQGPPKAQPAQPADTDKANKT